ncbi:hypothetical protein [Tenggerimyces flavus]|uniref:Glycosyltransferase RgtA/B/C/D-like domain-containing protein n=1 Tax=Tenggerimyces flavus TaxID=1708749 RepID=A0ABV7YB83_9ACTN|nr:hypothetical protein [Tenggerimyces flavus]MBM7787071.1 hypothetical protein [Tenggerimyces flavus]
MIVLAIPLGLFVAARLEIWFGGSVFTAYDTASYLPVSFTGHAPRLWGAPAFYALFPDDVARTFGQWLIGTIAWVALAVALAIVLRTFVARVLATTTVLALGLLPQVTNWDFAILSESLSISLGLLVLALLLLWLRFGKLPLLVALVVIAFAWTFVRPELVLLVGVVALVLAVRAVRKRQLATAIAAGLLIAGIGWSVAITPTVGKTFAGWSATGLTLREETLLYRLRLQVLADPRVENVFHTKLGMPDCPAMKRIVVAEQGKKWDMPGFAVAYRACPELRRWGAENAGRSGLRYVLAAPALFLEQTWSTMPRALVGTRYADVAAPLPLWADLVYFPRITVIVPVLLGSLSITLLAALAAGAWRRRRLLLGTGLILTVAASASVVAGLLYSTGENARFGMQEGVALRLAVLVLLATAVDSLLGRRRELRADTE